MKAQVICDPHPRTMDLLFSPEDRGRLEALANLHVWNEESRMPGELLEKHLPEAAAIIGQTDLPQERLDRAKNLRAVINVESNFLPNVDYETCFRRGIYVLSTAPAFGQAVAEMSLGLALALARGIPLADRLFRQGKEVYGRHSNRESFLIAGSDVGIIGFGNLGRSLLPLLAPFGCTIRVHDPWLPENHLKKLSLVPVSLAELLAASRIVFVLAGATEENRAMLGRKEFDLMPEGACLVLVSRAALVDFQALTEKLATGGIRAAVDVFPEEPFPKDHPIRGMDNVILSAHRTGSLASAYLLMGEMVVDDLAQILKGLPPVRLTQARRETVARMRSMPIKK